VEAGSLLEGDAVLMDRIEPGLPHQRHVASIGGLKPPGQEGRDSISADYTDVHQRRVRHLEAGGGRRSEGERDNGQGRSSVLLALAVENSRDGGGEVRGSRWRSKCR
jgi:hypothetical protein